MEIVHILLVDYMNELMYKHFLPKVGIFPEFEAISKKCYEVWSIANLETKQRVLSWKSELKFGG